MFGCARCNDSSHCTLLSSNLYYMETNQRPVRCSFPIPGCDVCLADDAVTWINCYSCMASYALINETLCSPCNQNMSHCNLCTSMTFCTGCDITYYVLPDNSGCESCSIIPQCYTCYSATHCTACLTTQYFISTDYLCHLCSEGIPFCLDCTINVIYSIYLCTACEPATYVNNSVCQSCSIPMPGCL